MKLFKHAVTVCVKKEDYLTVIQFLEQYAKPLGAMHVYATKDLNYIGFETHLKAHQLADVIEENLHEAKTNVVGGTVFVGFGR